MHALRRRLVLLATICLCSTATSLSAGDRPDANIWTLKDVDAVADAYIKAESERGGSGEANGIVLSLADALLKAHDTAKAKDVLLTASKLDVRDAFMAGEIIEKLAELKDYENADRIAEGAASSHETVARQGFLGVGYAKSGNPAGALKAVAAIMSAAKLSGSVPAARSDFDWGAPENALGRIAGELAKIGAADEAMTLAATLPDGLPKLRAVSLAAGTLCTAKKTVPGSLAKGRDLAGKAKTLAAQELATASREFEKIDRLLAASEAVLKCEGAVETNSFLAKTAPQQADDVLYKLADQLAGKQEIALSRALTPPVDPTDFKSLLSSVALRIKQKDTKAAQQLAAKAWQVFSDDYRKLGGQVRKVEFETQLGAFSDLFSTLGNYDAALTVVQPMDASNAETHYMSVLQMQMRKRDTAALKRTLPMAIRVFELPIPVVGSQAMRFIPQLIHELAASGYRDLAADLYNEKREELERAYASRQSRIGPWDMARMRVDAGDLKGAFEIANNAGALTAEPSPMLATIHTIMAFDGAKKPPTKDEFRAMGSRVEAMEPKNVSGPKAEALSAIATELATLGDVKSALQAEVELDSAHNDALTDTHDTVLAAIAEAQIKAGDLRGAYSSAMRISQSPVRKDVLLKLIVLPGGGAKLGVAALTFSS